jgi:hypothetical protein
VRFALRSASRQTNHHGRIVAVSEPEDDPGGKEDFADLKKIEEKMPDLFAEMRKDFADTPLFREIILLDSTGCNYLDDGVFIYHRSMHPNLDGMFWILENHRLVTAITSDDVDRYRMSEKLLEYLWATR